jgi:sugar O-acyltransferase (sialic acid O-acetyltransferase NeuD family)
MILGIYGSGGLGRAIMDLAQTINTVKREWEKVVFINDYKTRSVINGFEVYTFIEFMDNYPAVSTKVTIAVGEPKARRLLREKTIDSGFSLQTLIHPSVFIGSENQLGDGVVIQYGSFVEGHTKIDTNTLVLQLSSLGHDCIIGRDTVISPCVFLGGDCVIGNRVYVAAGVPVKEKLSIGSDSIIGMGSVVLREIPDGVIALGNPARAIRKNEDGRVFK